MEAIELMGKEVLPEFIERDEKAVAEKAKRLEPVLEKLEARRPASAASMSFPPGICFPPSGTSFRKRMSS